MIGNDYHRIRFLYRLHHILHTVHLPAVIFMVNMRDVRIMIFHNRAFLLQEADHIHRGRFTHIIYVWFVGYAQHKRLRALERFAAVVHPFQHTAHHITRHVCVDLGSQLDEPRIVMKGLHLPRKIERVNGNAVAAQARTRRKLHKTERFRSGSVDHLPHIHAEALAHDRQLIDQTNIDHAEGVLQ